MHHGSHLSSLGAASIDVGRRATYDPILSRASLAASQILLKASRADAARRLDVMQHELDRLAPGLDREVAVEMRRLVVAGRKPDQAAFDSMRVAIANRLMNSSLERVRANIGARYGWDALLDTPLGDISASDRQAGCLAAGAGTTVGGAVSTIPIYGQLVGGVMTIAGGITGQALDCGRETREAAARNAEAQRLLTEANLRAAEANASTAARRRQMMYVGGGMLAAIAIAGVLLLK